MKYNMVKLKELCTVNQGLQIPISKRYKEPGENRYFYITVQFLKDNGENYYIENPPKSVTCTEDEILVVRTGNTGQVITGVAGCFHNNFFKVTPNEKIYFKYLYYALNNKKMHDAMLNAASGTTIPDLKHSSFYDLEIPLPEISIQKKIAKILDNICDKLKLNNEINNNLYKLIKNNYESLINGCNWEEVELGAISNISSGKRPVDKSETGEYPVIGANGIMAYASDYNFNEDLIITGRVGTLGVVKRYLGKIWASDNTLVIQTKYLNYIENYLKTIDYYSLNRGSTQPLLTQGDLKKQIIYFNEELVTKFEKDNQIFVDKIRNNEKENSKLIQLRDTLLPKLMNGEINLDNIEI